MSLGLAALAVRMLATAVIVYAVGTAVVRLGPRIGGVVSGLPVVVGPGLLFVALDQPAEHLAAAATATVLALPATLVFMLAYGLAAATTPAALALPAGLTGWIVAAAILSGLTTSAPAAFAIFVAVALLFRRLLGSRLLQGRLPVSTAAPLPRPGVGLGLRSVLAGLLVGAVTIAADAAGPRAAGVLLAIPIAMIVIAVSVHQRQGAAAVVGTIRSAFLGTVSIAAFAATVALAAPALGPLPAVAAALAVSLAVTGMLLVLARHRQGPLA